MYTLPSACAHNYTHMTTLLGKLQWVLVSRVFMVFAGYVTWALCSVWHLLLELMTHRSLMETNFKFRMTSSVDAAVNQFIMFPSWHWGALFIYSQTCASKALLFGSHFSFCPYIPPYPSLPPSLLEQMYCYSSTLPPVSPTRTLALCLSLSYILV